MLSNYFISSLAQTLSVGGNDTEISLSTIYTQDGQVVTTADFAQFSRGVITINPTSLSGVEFASFTTVDPSIGNNGGISGVSRGLSFKGNNQIPANQKFNVVGTPVIISFGTHNIQDIMDVVSSNKTYLEGLINSMIVVNGVYASDQIAGVTKLSTAPALTIGTPTISVANPAVVTLASHGLSIADSIRFTTTGALPTGLIVGTTYYIIAAGFGANSFELSLTAGGTAIVTTGTQSGVHTLIRTTPVAVGINDTTQLPTVAQKAALVGTQGAPSATNTYVTLDNVYASTYDQQQTTQNSTVEFGMASTTGQKNKINQSFTPVKTKNRGVHLYKTADTGVFTGTVTVALYADSAGSPTGLALGTVTLTNAQWLAMPVGEFEVIFSSEYSSQVAGSLYWIQVSSSTADNSNHPNLGTNTAGGYANGSAKYWNTTDGYVAIANIDLYFKTLQGTTNQLSYISSIPTTTIINPSVIGDSSTTFTITNTSGTTYRYTFTGTGTNPSISAATFPVGLYVDVQASGFNSNNKGQFTVTGSGTNYFEVTNAAGVAEATKTIGTGFINKGAFWTKPAGLKYIEVEVQAGGASGGAAGATTSANGGGAGGYSFKTIVASLLLGTEPVLAGPGGIGTNSGDGAISLFRNLLSASKGLNTGAGGVGSSGDINIAGGGGGSGDTQYSGTHNNGGLGGAGGSSMLGGGAAASTSSINAGLYGGGGNGGQSPFGGSTVYGGNGGNGVVIVKEYYY